MIVAYSPSQPLKVLKSQKKHKDIDNAHAFSPIDDVKKNYQKNTSKNKNLILIKGKVEDTLKIRKNLPKKIIGKLFKTFLIKIIN